MKTFVPRNTRTFCLSFITILTATLAHGSSGLYQLELDSSRGSISRDGTSYGAFTRTSAPPFYSFQGSARILEVYTSTFSLPIDFAPLRFLADHTETFTWEFTDGSVGDGVTPVLSLYIPDLNVPDLGEVSSDHPPTLLTTLGMSGSLKFTPSEGGGVRFTGGFASASGTFTISGLYSSPEGEVDGVSQSIVIRLADSTLLTSRDTGVAAQYWNGGETSPDGTVHGGSGTWDGAATNWTDANGLRSLAWDDDAATFGGKAVFSGTAGKVSLASDARVTRLEFASDGYEVVSSGGALVIGAANTELRTASGVSARIAASLTGTGGILKSGSGLLDLTGSNTYAGSTYITSGMLSLTGTGASISSGATGDVLVHEGALLVAGGASVSVLNTNLAEQAGSVGQVFLSGTGTQWRSGGDFTVGGSGEGFVVVQAGAVLSVEGETSFGVELGSRGGALIHGASTRWESVGNAAVGRAGRGHVAVSGAGALWEVKGNLAVGGSGEGGSVMLLNGGKVTVAGDYSQAANGTLHIELSSGKTGSLAVGRSAYLDGALELSLGAGFRIKAGERYTLITAEEISGEFATTTEIFTGTLVEVSTVYRSGSVTLEFNQGSFAALAGAYALTPNQLSIARALDKISADSRVSGLIETLNTLPLDDVPNAVAALSPEEFVAIFNAGFASNQVHAENIERRLDDVRNGAAGFSANGLALRDSRGSLEGGLAPGSAGRQAGLTLAGWDGQSIVGKQSVAPIVDSTSRWGFFATGAGEFGDVESTANAVGTRFTTGGVTVGVDYRLADSIVLGATLGYTRTESDLSNGGNLEVNGGNASLYGTIFGGGFYLNGAVGGGYNSYSTKRHTLGGFAKGDSQGGNFNALLGGGYDWRAGGFTVGPVASLRYTYVGIEGFTEHGSLAPLHIASQGQDSLQSALGLKATYTWNVGGIVITPEVRAQWLHEYLDSTAAIESRFAAGSSFIVHGPQIGRDSLLVDAGASVGFTPAVSVFAYYTGEIGRKNYSFNSVNGGVRIGF